MTRCSAHPTRARSGSPRSSARSASATASRTAGRTPHLKRVIPASTVAATIHELLRGVVTVRDRPVGPDPRGRRGRQDGDHDRRGRRLVRRLDAAVHDRGVGRLPEQAWCRCSPSSTAARSAGGTFPAEIWRAYMESALQINAEEHPAKPGNSSATATTTGANTSTHLHVRAGHRPRHRRPTAHDRRRRARRPGADDTASTTRRAGADDTAADHHRPTADDAGGDHPHARRRPHPRPAPGPRPAAPAPVS